MDIKNSKMDLSVSVLKGLAGTIPILGSLIGEVLGNIIPNQRIDRICALIQIMDAKLKTLEKSTIEKFFTNPLFVDLLEDGFIQASRALSSDRIEHIASLLVNTLSEDEINYNKTKRFLILLSELTDQEILILGSKYYSWSEFPEYHERHKESLKTTIPTLASEENEIEEYFLHDSYLQHIAQLGLLKQTYNFKTKFNHALTDLEVDMQPAGYALTKLGDKFLQFLQSKDA